MGDPNPVIAAGVAALGTFLFPGEVIESIDDFGYGNLPGYPYGVSIVILALSVAVWPCWVIPQVLKAEEVPAEAERKRSSSREEEPMMRGFCKNVGMAFHTRLSTMFLHRRAAGPNNLEF